MSTLARLARRVAADIGGCWTLCAAVLALLTSSPAHAQSSIVRLPPPSSAAAPVYQAWGAPPERFDPWTYGSGAAAAPVDRLQHAPPASPEWYPTPPVTAASPLYTPYASQPTFPPTGYEAAHTSAAEPALDLQDEPDAPGASTSNVPKGAKDGVL